MTQNSAERLPEKNPLCGCRKLSGIIYGQCRRKSKSILEPPDSPALRRLSRRIGKVGGAEDIPAGRCRSRAGSQPAATAPAEPAIPPKPQGDRQRRERRSHLPAPVSCRMFLRLPDRQRCPALPQARFPAPRPEGELNPRIPASAESRRMACGRTASSRGRVRCRRPVPGRPAGACLPPSPAAPPRCRRRRRPR